MNREEAFHIVLMVDFNLIGTEYAGGTWEACSYCCVTGLEVTVCQEFGPCALLIRLKGDNCERDETVRSMAGDV